MGCMSHTTTTDPVDELPEGHRSEVAGDAWGRRARDWACLFEHYATDVTYAILDRIGVTESSDLLDIACGSGLALRHAAARGSRIAGIDAAASLVDIARTRNPGADVRTGTMFELPWPDESFDAVSSINGIWGGCGAALAEAYRVLRPGGRIGISFWGSGQPLDLRRCFKVFAMNSPTDHVNGMVRTNDIAGGGVAEEMLDGAGFGVIERGSCVSSMEWPDDDIAWPALSSVGPAVRALEHVGAEVCSDRSSSRRSSGADESGTYHFRNDQQFVIAEKEPT